MILGYNFVEERLYSDLSEEEKLFAAANYVNLAQPFANRLRAKRDYLANRLNDARKKYAGNQSKLDTVSNRIKQRADRAEDHILKLQDRSVRKQEYLAQKAATKERKAAMKAALRERRAALKGGYIGYV